MSKPFTATAGQTWQALLDEITLAYSERRQVLGQDPYEPQAGRNVQDLSYWLTMQGWLEANCVNFVDHVNGPLNDAGDALRPYTISTWRAAAGIPASGFRRATAWSGAGDPDWSFGPMQDGDIIGYWVFQDLQRGLGALAWRGVQWGLDYPIPGHRGLGGSDEPWAGTTWGATPWIQGMVYMAWVVTIRAQWRVRGRCTVTQNLPVPWSCSFYGLPQGMGDLPFVDIDGYGMVNGKFFLISETLKDSSDQKYSAMLGNTEVEPFSATPSGAIGISAFGGYANAVIKPEYSNA